MLEIDEYKTSERMRLYLERIYPRAIEKANSRKLESPRLGVVGKKTGGIDNSIENYLNEFIENNRIKQSLELCIENLEPEYSAIIRMYYLEGYSDLRIKQEFKIANGTYYRHKQKALVDLAVSFVAETRIERIVIYKKIAV